MADCIDLPLRVIVYVFGNVAHAAAVYITTVTGVQVFDAKGQYLGAIKAGRQAANVAFSGPGKQTLYLTAREGLYRVNTLSRGPDRLGK